MKASQLSQFLLFCIQNNLPALIKGAPGIGKSDIVEAACMAAGADLIISHPVVSDPTDFKGMPYVGINEAGHQEAHFLPFNELNRLINADRPTVFFLDDLGQAPASVQAACMQLILARRINGFKVSKHVVFIAATNRKEDKAAVSGILEPVKSRFASIVELEVNVDDWVNWALSDKGNMPVELVAFVKFKPSHLTAFEATKDIVNTPCPRTIARVGQMQNAKLAEELEFEAFKGAVGEAFAAEYTAFLKLYKQLPSVDSILMNPDKAEVPTEPSVQYALSMAIASKMSDVNIDAAIRYINRLPVEISVACIKDAVVRSEKLTQTRAFIQWASKNGSVILS